MLVYFFLSYTGPWVLAAHPAFPAPLIGGWKFPSKLGRFCAARRRRCVCSLREIELKSAFAIRRHRARKRRNPVSADALDCLGASPLAMKTQRHVHVQPTGNYVVRSILQSLTTPC